MCCPRQRQDLAIVVGPIVVHSLSGLNGAYLVIGLTLHPENLLDVPLVILL